MVKNREREFNLEDIVDLQAWPVSEVDRPEYSALVDRLARELAQQQYCVLDAFMRPEAIAQAVQHVNQVVEAGYRNESHRNCYLRRQRNPNEADDHPDNIFFDASYTMLAANLFSDVFVLKKLYYWQPMIDFVARITQSPALYPGADAYQPVNVLCSGAGDQSAWHFDSWNAFTMTLMLQSAERGGHFELVPGMRTKEDSNFAGVSKVLKGDQTSNVRVPRDPGALVIFRGSTALHRVSPVLGKTSRLMGVFVYEDRPGVVGDPEVNATVYGPTASRQQYES